MGDARPSGLKKRPWVWWICIGLGSLLVLGMIVGCAAMRKTTQRKSTVPQISAADYARLKRDDAAWEKGVAYYLQNVPQCSAKTGTAYSACLAAAWRRVPAPLSTAENDSWRVFLRLADIKKKHTGGCRSQLFSYSEWVGLTLDNLRVVQRDYEKHKSSQAEKDDTDIANMDVADAHNGFPMVVADCYP